ncbi:MAG: hypothetical protein JNM75_14250 [Rhodospirillales bacterium]|nr:hypothetical protein [Rhodospirillales bacterium]
MSPRTGKARPPARFLRAFKAAVGTEDWDRAEALAEAALAARPDCAEAHFAHALVAIYRDDLAAALERAARANGIAPGIGDFEDLLAVVHALAGDLNSALFHGKAAADAPRLAHLAGMAPAGFPSLAQAFLQISEAPLRRRGLAALDRKRWAEAERWFRQHLVFAPDDREAFVGLGVSLLAQDAPVAAVETLRAARHRLPHDAAIASLLGRALTRAGAFGLARACHASARLLAPEDGDVAAAGLLDATVDPGVAGPVIAAGYADWCRSFAVADGGGARSQRAGGSDRRLTVGYVIASAGETSAGPWLAEILSHRNAARFKTVGFGHGPLSTPANQVFQKCVDRWQDVAGADAPTLAAMVRGEDVDILVDLVGLEAPELHAAFASRMAPCQVGWLGLPALAAPCAVDFVLTDRFVADRKGKARGRAAGARLIDLSLGSVVAPPPTPVAAAAAAAAAGEGEDPAELLFAADAGLDDLNATTAEWWSAILHAVPEAKLILRDRNLTQPAALAQVLDIFGTFGVAHRVDVVAEASPRAFFAHGDVGLLPYPAPRPASLTDALSAGLPVVCPAGGAGRAAASILDHLGLSAGTIAADRDRYVAHAIAWARDGAARAAFPARIAEACAQTGVWDAAARVRDLEDAFARMWAALCADDAGPTRHTVGA